MVDDEPRVYLALIEFNREPTRTLIVGVAGDFATAKRMLRGRMLTLGDADPEWQTWEPRDGAARWVVWDNGDLFVIERHLIQTDAAPAVSSGVGAAWRALLDDVLP
jgi:hypothetical protein